MATWTATYIVSEQRFCNATCNTSKKHGKNAAAHRPRQFKTGISRTYEAFGELGPRHQNSLGVE